jgi:hypothetical protein
LYYLQVFLEDAGFDWKILGPDVHDFDYVAWQCDQDAYACSGQKCSAQSILFMHDAWAEAGAWTDAVGAADMPGPQFALGEEGSCPLAWTVLRLAAISCHLALPSAQPAPHSRLPSHPAGLEKALARRAASRKLEDLTVGPVLSVTTETMMAHTQRLLQIPGAGSACAACATCAACLRCLPCLCCAVLPCCWEFRTEDAPLINGHE